MLENRKIVNTGLEFSKTFNSLSKNTPEYKTICLVMYIITGLSYWHIEGTTNHTTQQTEIN